MSSPRRLKKSEPLNTPPRNLRKNKWDPTDTPFHEREIGEIEYVSCYFTYERGLLAVSFRQFLAENPFLRPATATGISEVVGQVKETEHWLVDFGSIQFVANLLAFLLNEIILQSMMMENSTEREGFQLNYQTYEEVIQRVVPGNSNQIS